MCLPNISLNSQKRMKRRLIILLYLVLTLSVISKAQVDKDLVAVANEIFEFGDYEDALGIYVQATEINPENAEAYLMAGRCYLKTVWGKNKSIEQLRKAYDLDPTITSNILFLVGEGYRHSYKFDEAINFYGLYKEELEINRRDFLGIDVDAEAKKTERRIYECENAQEYVTDTTEVTIENLGDVINSEYEDYAPTISLDETEIYFTSKRYGSVGDFKDVDNKYFEDIWYSKKDDDEWTPPVNIGTVINTRYHNSNIAISPDGDILYIYTDDNGGDIHFSEKKKGVWGKPEPLKGINTEYRESSISFTSDGKMMFYTSSDPTGYGSTDIYFCFLDEEGKCKDDPKNLGEAINSPYAEESPYYDLENNKLYFASKGHKGMGGFDIFSTDYDETSDSWTDPINLGYPVNSTDDDLFITLSGDGNTAYYSTAKEDSRGQRDIYKIYPINGKPDVLPDSAAADTAGKRENINSEIIITVIDEKGNPLEAKLELFDKKYPDDVLSSDIVSSKTYDFSHDEAKTFIITIEKEGYIYQTVNVKLGVDNGDQKIDKIITLKPVKEFVVNPLRNIYFGFDKHTLTSQSTPEINKLEDLLKSNEKMVIEIAGHTDHIGSEEYNTSLSKSRAGAVRRALIKRGIAPERIISKGYGEKYPLATNDDEQEGRELNRRTEFIIIKK